MVAVILIDMVATLAGQPPSYWSDPGTVDEGNRLFRWIMSKGFVVALLAKLLYAGGSFLLVSVLPWRLGLTLLFALVLGHYFGASTWLCYRYQLGAAGMVLYGVLLAAALVVVGFHAGSRKPRR
ncbi:MAG TPA: hypothetical protein PLA50_18300 [Bacteroidia bacterium]|nr:hypothetical protein [Bacteroidia bacterium]